MVNASERRSDATILADSRNFARARNGIAAWQVLSTIACLAALLFLVARLPLAWTWAPLALLAGVLVRIFVLQHDAGHNSLFSSCSLNDRAGTLISFITGIPFDAWRTEHAWHHAHQGKLSHRGVDRMNSPMTVAEAREDSGKADLRAKKISLRSVFFLGAVSLVVLRKAASGFFQFRPGFRWAFGGHDRMRRSVWLTNAGHAAVNVAGIAALGWRWLLVVAAAWAAAGLGANLFWIQHNFERTWHADDEEWSFVRVALEGSSYLRLGPVLRWFTASIGLHHVHHLNPGIPNYRLEEARRAVAELRAVAPLSRTDVRRCYTHVFWDAARGRMVPRGEAGAVAAARTGNEAFPLPVRSPSGHLLQAFRVARPVHGDLRGGIIDAAKVLGRERDVQGAEVLVQAMQLGRARDRNDPRVA